VDLNRDFSGGNGNYTWDFKFANLPASFTLGGEWSAMDDTRKGFVNNAGVAGDLRRDELDQANSRDAYAILQLQATEYWEWLAGVRRSRVELSVEDYFVIPGKNADDSGEKTFNRSSATLSTRYHINDQVSLHAALGNGFETPTLTEMAYTNGDRGFNNTLDAATNRQQEIGLDYRSEKFAAGVTVFVIKTRDELVVDQSNNGRTTYINATATERKGVELNSRYEFNAYLDARFAVNYLDATYTAGQFNGLQLPGVAKQNHYAQINWSPFKNEVLKLGLSAVHRSQVAANDNNQIKAPAYTTIDLTASGSVDLPVQVDWWLKLANLTDKNYVGSVIVIQTNGRAFEPASGRFLAAGVKLSYDL
jgi:iron complex outermembrane receptor protein